METIFDNNGVVEKENDLKDLERKKISTEKEIQGLINIHAKQ
jgi:hypothetical protein